MPKKPIDHYEHPDKRMNNPTQELSGFAEDEENAPTRYPRDTALDPQLVWKGKDQQKRIKQILDQHETSLVDDGWRILNEDKRYVNLKTRKRIGDLFVKTLLQNLSSRQEICTMVRIKPLGDSNTDFAEFPEAKELSTFDVADRKFIAVAIAYERDHAKKATILQALDGKWEPFRKAFEREGVQIDFLCPHGNEA